MPMTLFQFRGTGLNWGFWLVPIPFPLSNALRFITDNCKKVSEKLLWYWNKAHLQLMLELMLLVRDTDIMVSADQSTTLQHTRAVLSACSSKTKASVCLVQRI